MSTAHAQPADEQGERPDRILLARRDLYQSGNSRAVSLPKEVLENVPFGIGEQVNIFARGEDRELVLTHDTKAYYQEPETVCRGSRKVRTNTHGTVLVTAPQKALLEDFGYDSLEEADQHELAITIDPQTCDLFVEFPDE